MKFKPHCSDALPKSDILNYFHDNKKEIQTVAQSYGIHTLALSGSITKNDFDICGESDVDIVVMGDKKLELNSKLDVMDYFEKALRRDIDIIDLLDKEYSLDFLINVLDNIDVIFHDEKIFLDYYCNIEDIIKNNSYFWSLQEGWYFYGQ